MSCYVSWYVMLCYARCHDVRICRVMSCYVMLCHIVMACHFMLCHGVECHVMPLYAMVCHVMLCHVMLYYVTFVTFLYLKRKHMYDQRIRKGNARPQGCIYKNCCHPMMGPARSSTASYFALCNRWCTLRRAKGMPV